MTEEGEVVVVLLDFTCCWRSSICFKLWICTDWGGVGGRGMEHGTTLGLGWFSFLMMTGWWDDDEGWFTLSSIQSIALLSSLCISLNSWGTERKILSFFLFLFFPLIFSNQENISLRFLRRWWGLYTNKKELRERSQMCGAMVFLLRLLVSWWMTDWKGLDVDGQLTVMRWEWEIFSSFVSISFSSLSLLFPAWVNETISLPKWRW